MDYVPFYLKLNPGFTSNCCDWRSNLFWDLGRYWCLPQIRTSAKLQHNFKIGWDFQTPLYLAWDALWCHFSSFGAYTKGTSWCGHPCKYNTYCTMAIHSFHAKRCIKLMIAVLGHRVHKARAANCVDVFFTVWEWKFVCKYRHQLPVGTWLWVWDASLTVCLFPGWVNIASASHCLASISPFSVCVGASGLQHWKHTRVGPHLCVSPGRID